MADKTRIMPLEANPISFNSLAQKLGLDTSQFCIHDILGFDDELLALIPRPVKAAILLYPTPKRFDDPVSLSAEEEVKKRWPFDDSSEEVVFIRQTLSNHCGTMV